MAAGCACAAVFLALADSPSSQAPNIQRPRVRSCRNGYNFMMFLVVCLSLHDVFVYKIRTGRSFVNRKRVFAVKKKKRNSPG